MEALAFLLAALAYLWFLLKPCPWLGFLLAVPIGLSWRVHHRSARDLGLDPQAFRLAFSRWRVTWIVSIILLLLLGWRTIFGIHTLERGAIYFVWCAAQQLVLQSMIYLPLRQAFQKQWPAVLLAAMAFSVIHAPNPVLVPGTFAWGAVSCLLFEDVPSVWGLALLQVILSSLLLWVTPYSLNHGFRIGPIYNR